MKRGRTFSPEAGKRSRAAIVIAVLVLTAGPLPAQDVIWNQGRKPGGVTMNQKALPSAHVLGLGFSWTGYTYDQWGKPFANNDVTTDDGYSGIHLFYHLVKPEAVAYFSPTLIYDFVKNEHSSSYGDSTWYRNQSGTSHRRYFYFAANAGFNLQSLLPRELPVQPFLEAGAGIFIMEVGYSAEFYEGGEYGSYWSEYSGNEWRFLPVGFNVLGGARYWFTEKIGVEGGFRYINCFLDLGLTDNGVHEFGGYTFRDLDLSFGITLKP
ncbi:MAG: hypothetical protein C4524_10565 [Candidatus Zixiibacteriota bacterium]|nr:MAG: hypothetical protein C4524_10565 [candidate division Zixibacteria bacterium]